MKLKLTTFSLMLIGLASIACRQGEETFDQEEQVSLHEDENQMNAKDSTGSGSGFENNDPPKNGTHWKTASDDTIKVITPKNLLGGLLDSSSDTGIDNNDTDPPQNPPKNGTHWRAR